MIRTRLAWFASAMLSLAPLPVAVAQEAAREKQEQEEKRADRTSAATLRYYAIEAELALWDSPITGGLAIEVHPDSQKPAIILKGEVASTQLRTLAERVVRRALDSSGIELINQIRVGVPEAGDAPAGVPTPLDQEQMKKLRSMLEEEFPKLAGNISVAFDVQPMPTIVLEGLIPSYEQKLEVSRFVRNHFKAMPVLNNIRVKRMREGDASFYVVSSSTPQDRVPVESQKTGALATEGGSPEDAEIAKQLGATLVNDPVIKSASIQLRVEDGVVWLSGGVESLGQKIRAIRLASKQPGVRYVVNQLVISPPTGQPAGVIIQNAEPADVRHYVERYVDTRIPELRGAAVDIKDHTIVITPPRGIVLHETESVSIRDRIQGLPEVKGFEVIVKMETDVK